MNMRWSRFKYHVNAALLLLPLYFLVTTLIGTEAEGSATSLAPKSVGSWQVAPKAAGHWPPRPGQELDMTVRFDAGPVAQIRAAVLTIGDQAPAATDLLSPTAGLLHGGEVLREAHVPVPAAMPSNAGLWLTVERWDGSLHHVSWALGSP